MSFAAFSFTVCVCWGERARALWKAQKKEEGANRFHFVLQADGLGAIKAAALQKAEAEVRERLGTPRKLPLSKLVNLQYKVAKETEVDGDDDRLRSITTPQDIEAMRGLGCKLIVCTVDAPEPPKVKTGDMAATLKARLATIGCEEAFTTSRVAEKAVVKCAGCSSTVFTLLPTDRQRFRLAPYEKHVVECTDAQQHVKEDVLNGMREKRVRHLRKAQKNMQETRSDAKAQEVSTQGQRTIAELWEPMRAIASTVQFATPDAVGADAASDSSSTVPAPVPATPEPSLPPAKKTKYSLL
ncbi:hypothetical protein DIPPA_29534 [Diplonema papillatum]|nr:hypothetical protein DIPPA_29534 [Diplonema papillatum]